MRSFIRLACALMLALATLVAAPGAQADSPDQNEQRLIQQAKQDGKVRVLVRFANAADREAVTSKLAAKRSSVTVKAQFKYVPLVALETNASALEELARNPTVQRIQLDAESAPTLDSSVPLIGADEVQRRGITGKGQNIAILDSGIDTDHPFYEGSIVAEACFSDPANFENEETLCPSGENEEIGDGAADAETGQCIDDDRNICDHGTHVAGIAAGSDNDADAPGNGVAPGAGLIAVQVFHRDNSEEDCGDDPAPCVRTYDSDQIAAMEYLLDLPDSIDIAAVNMSLGNKDNNQEHCDDDARKEYVDLLLERGAATVISSGNEGHAHGVGTPGCISSAVTVGNSTDDDVPDSSSNRGPLIDLFAPGHDINSSVPDDGYGGKSGTSMAAPHVAGAFALLREVDPGASIDELLKQLRDTGKDITYESGDGRETTPRIALDKAIPRDSTALDYTGPTSGAVNEEFTASARLTVDGKPRTNQEVEFRLGSGGGTRFCTGTTNSSGVATCELTPTEPGEIPLTATFRGTDQLEPASDSVKFTVGKQATVTEYTGPVEADFHDSFTASARLTAGGEAVSGQPISFVLGGGGGSQACTGTTNAAGVASCSMTPTQTPGRTTITASFGGTDNLLPSNDSTGFTVTRQQTAVVYTGPKKVANGVPARLSAVLTEETRDGPPISGREVTVALGRGDDRQACTGTTNGSGVVECTIPLLDQPLNDDATVPVAVDFAGDAFYLPSHDSATVLLEYYTGRSYGLSADVRLPLLEVGVEPTPDTGPIRTAHASSTTTPCAASLSVLLLVEAHALCPDVTTSLAPGTSRSTAKVENVSIGLPGLPVIEVDGASARSTSTCGNGGSATGKTDVRLRIGGELVTVTGEVDAEIDLPGAARLVVNEQLPVEGADHGLTVNAVHLIVGDGLTDIVVASATSDVHNCAS